MKNLFFVLGIMLFSLNACEESSLRKEYNVQDFSSDHASQSWDSTSTANKLIGSWQWVYTESCVEGNLTGEGKTSEEFIVEIRSTEIRIYRQDEFVESTGWSLEIEDGSYFGINTQSGIHQLRGRILFSGDRILFQNSYLDGTDNYFIKYLVED